MTDPKSLFANAPDNSANDSALSFALRQLQRTLSRPMYWVIVGAVIFMAALAGPYFTLERMTFPERVVFWGATLIVSAVTMTFLNIFAAELGRRAGVHWSIAAALAGAVGTMPVAGSLYLAQGLVTGFAPGWTSWAPLSAVLISVAPSALAVSVFVELVLRLQQGDTSASSPSAESVEPVPALTITPFQKKLPAHLGHDIVAVRAQDHYVEAFTPQGSAMVLMRLSDAEEQLAPLNGLRVHRSWWVNLSHIARMERGANGPEIVTTLDQRIPVGRSYRAKFDDMVGD